jgi:hypothetical protein
MELFSRTALGLLSLTLAFAGTATAVEPFRKPTVAFAAGNGTLLASRSSPVKIHADAADWPGVLRAAHDLAIDFGRVTGVNGSLTVTGKATLNPSAIFNVTGIPSDWSVGSSSNGSYGTGAGAGTIIVGTIGNSSVIDGMIASGKLDVSAVQGQWESYVSTYVENVGNGTGSALVIAGELGRIFHVHQLLTLSRQRSPWCHLRHLRCFGTDRCLTMVLVRRCTTEVSRLDLRSPDY